MHCTRRAIGLAGLGLAWALPVQARISGLGDAINKAGAQRMLSQRMGKAWLALNLPELSDRARKVLEASLLRFENQLQALRAFAPTAEIASSYASLSARFAEYRALLSQPPARGQVNELLRHSGAVLSIAHAATGQLQAQSRDGAARLVNVSGRQRMLSQRLGLYFLADQMGADPAIVRHEISQARSEFLAAHTLLAQAPETTPGIRANLELAQAQWIFLAAALSGTTVGDKAGADVFVASENLLAVMETVTGQYARILG